MCVPVNNWLRWVHEHFFVNSFLFSSGFWQLRKSVWKQGPFSSCSGAFSPIRLSFINRWRWMRSLNIWVKTVSADEAHEMWSTAPEQLLNGPEIVFFVNRSAEHECAKQFILIKIIRLKLLHNCWYNQITALNRIKVNYLRAHILNVMFIIRYYVKLIPNLPSVCFYSLSVESNMGSYSWRIRMLITVVIGEVWRCICVTALPSKRCCSHEPRGNTNPSEGRKTRFIAHRKPPETKHNWTTNNEAGQ